MALLDDIPAVIIENWVETRQARFGFSFRKEKRTIRQKRVVWGKLGPDEEATHEGTYGGGSWDLVNYGPEGFDHGSVLGTWFELYRAEGTFAP